MIKDSAILVLGAGQIGRAACVEIIKHEPRTLILHTLTKEEAVDSLSWIESNFFKMGTKVVPSYGDVLIVDPKSKISELDYRFGAFTPEVCKASALWKLIKKFKPDMIVDGINTATVVGYGHDPFTTSRRIKKVLDSGELPDKNSVMELLKESLLAEAIPPLVRFTQVLHQAMLEFRVKRYVKISTSGLGGMGFNIPYTHGDVGEPGCSPRLLGKVAASGILNQLIWTLSHTPGVDIKMVIPTALVGWEDITADITLRKNGKDTPIPLVDCEKPLNLAKGNVFQTHKAKDTGQILKMAAVDSGENGFYGLGDMTTITALGQMGCITKEEVGFAVAEALEGSTKYDICAALDAGCLGPSFNAAFERNFILNKMKELNSTLEYPSVAAGNLGPKVTKHLWELEILRRIALNLQNIADADIKDLTLEAEKLLMKSSPRLRSQILSLKMPIIMEGGRLLLGNSWHIPPGPLPDITPENIEIWAQKGWVDLRESRMNYWQQEIRHIVEFFRQSRRSPHVKLQRNWRTFALDTDFDIGEVLGLVYSLSGGDRKL